MNNILSFIFCLLVTNVYCQGEWKIPKNASELANPFSVNVAFIEKGEKLYQQNCVVCHGKEGLGDGVAATGLNPSPTNFTKQEFQEQHKGIIFSKLSKGNGVMAAYENSLSEEDRWALVEYLKTFKKKKK